VSDQASPHPDARTAVATAVATAFLARNLETIGELLGDDATFRSPVTEYTGRDLIMRILTAAVEVIGEMRRTSTLEAAGEVAVFFTAPDRDRGADGVLHVTAGAGGEIELTLMLRPLATLLAGIEEMRGALNLPIH
jgi:hypothetical protein